MITCVLGGMIASIIGAFLLFADGFYYWALMIEVKTLIIGAGIIGGLIALSVISSVEFLRKKHFTIRIVTVVIGGAIAGGLGWWVGYLLEGRGWFSEWEIAQIGVYFGAGVGLGLISWIEVSKRLKRLMKILVSPIAGAVGSLFVDFPWRFGFDSDFAFFMLWGGLISIAIMLPLVLIPRRQEGGRPTPFVLFVKRKWAYILIALVAATVLVYLCYIPLAARYYLWRLHHENFGINDRVISALAKERSIFPGLLRMLEDESAYIRDNAVWVLGCLGNKEAVEPLIQLFKDRGEQRSIRCNTAFSLRDLKDGRAVEALLEVLSDLSDEDGVRVYAACALGELKDKSAVEPLLSVLINKSESVDLRVNSANALGKLGDKRAFPPLLNVIDDIEQELKVRHAALKGIETFVGRRFATAYGSSAKEKEQAITKWQQWWEKNKEKFLKKAGK